MYNFIKIKKKDTVKSEINYNDNCIRFYINSISNGIAFNNIIEPVKPGVCLYSPGNSVELINIE